MRDVNTCFAEQTHHLVHATVVRNVDGPARRMVARRLDGRRARGTPAAHARGMATHHGAGVALGRRNFGGRSGRWRVYTCRP